jgi:flagellin-like hook-associated protein FlgL
VADGDLASQAALQAIQFENTANSDRLYQSGTSFSLGGENWATLKPVQTRAGQGKEVWNLTLNGRDVGKERDLWIAAVSNGKNEVETPGLDKGIINGLDRYSFVEIQDADNGPWTGAEVRTQSSAQEALEALNGAMERKDKVRADIGALQNRLENTITNLEIQIESLQNSESRISDVDVATEMTEFVRNQVLAQAAVSMLSQANSLPQMALSLLNG